MRKLIAAALLAGARSSDGERREVVAYILSLRPAAR